MNSHFLFIVHLLLNVTIFEVFYKLHDVENTIRYEVFVFSMYRQCKNTKVSHEKISTNKYTSMFYAFSILVKGASRLGAVRCHPSTPRLKAGDAPSRRRHLGALLWQGATWLPDSPLATPSDPSFFSFSFSFSFSFFFFLFFFFFFFSLSG